MTMLTINLVMNKCALPALRRAFANIALRHGLVKKL